MRSSLVRIAFNTFTAPGVIIWKAIQTASDNRYDVPQGRVAVWGELNRKVVVENRKSLSDVNRLLDDGESPRDGEHVIEFTDYEALDDYREMLVAVMGPAVVMTLFAILLFGLFSVLRITGAVNNSVLAWWAGVYPGFAVAVHALPQPGPTAALWRRTRDITGAYRVPLIMFVGTGVVLNGMRVVWVSLFYAFFLFWFTSTLFGLPL